MIIGSTTLCAAVRLPTSNSPVTDVTSPGDITCTINIVATETISVPAESAIGFNLDNTIYHQGPAAIYLGKAPRDGSGANWFKPSRSPNGELFTFNPFTFTAYSTAQLTTTIQVATPSGDYLVRIEQIGLHVVDASQ